MKLPYHGVRAHIRFGWYAVKIGLASLYRHVLGGTRFIGVTGSSGKTTTTQLIGAFLATQGPCRISYMPTNRPENVASTIFSLRPRHRFCVHELGGSEPQRIAKTVTMFRPHIGVVTRISYDHYSAFRSLEAIAKEKGRLVEALPASGTAILNADEPLVLAMRELTKAQVITFGLSEGAMVRGAEVVSGWPEPLSLTVAYDGTRLRVQTQLLGEHWAPAVLAALATGIAMGVPLPEAAEALSGVPPVCYRLSPHHMTDGVTFIQDTCKAPAYTVPASLRVMETARAPRKIVIIGTVTDYQKSASKVYKEIAQQALKVADHVMFAGRWAASAIKGRSPQDGHRLLGFADVYELRNFLRGFLAPGDLVLLKGSAPTDHLERLVLDWEGEFPCWRLDCKRYLHCTDCRLQGSHFVPVSSPG